MISMSWRGGTMMIVLRAPCNRWGAALRAGHQHRLPPQRLMRVAATGLVRMSSRDDGA
jgi:hypothetical protein